jgi:AcrR family transcriptional regulator
VSGSEAVLEGTVKAKRKPRVDGARNRSTLIEVARSAFDTEGVDVSLYEVARRANVGIGTLYRHFPTRDALVLAVYQQGIDDLCRSADRLLESLSPADAIAAWMAQFVDFLASRQGIIAALRAALDASVFNDARHNVTAASSRLMSAAVAAGEVRTDAETFDLTRVMAGLSISSESPDWREQADLTIGIIFDGLRCGADRPS